MASLKWLAMAFGLTTTLVAPLSAQVSVRGTVRDSATKQLLNGAIVEMAGLDTRYAVRTDEEGDFQIRDAKPGAYRAVIRRIGYAMVTTEIIVDDRMKKLDIRLSPIPQALARVNVRGEGTGIYGKIGTATELKPITGAEVYVAGARDSAFTDSTGAYFVSLKRPGTYMVRVQAPGFTDETFVVEVKRNQVVDGSRLLDIGAARSIPGILWKDFDQRLAWATLNKASLMTGAEVRRAGGSISVALKQAGAMVARGMKLGPSVCVFVNGQPRPGYPLDAIRPEEIRAMEVYGARSEVLLLLMSDWPPEQKCTETFERTLPYGPVPIRAVVIWTK